VKPRRSRNTTEEALEASHPIELGHLVADPLLERPVQFRELGGLALHGVVQLLHAHEGADPGQELGLVHGLGEKVVGPRFEPLDPLLRGIERGDHHHGQDPGGRVVADLATDLVAAHLRHHYVEQHEIRALGVDLAEGLGP
jgi:hypothetical protein